MFNYLIKILDFVYKKKCYFCRSSFENTVMCTSCYDKMEELSLGAILCVDGVSIYSSCQYAKEMQKLIRAVKYHNQRELAFYQAKFMYEYFIKMVGENESFVIVPVPMHKKRYKQRKYNHMELVGKALSELSGWELNTNLIYRIKETKPQYKLKTNERIENLTGAFKVLPENYKGENLLIIDDILTTGSTLSEMIREFKNHKISKITCLTSSTVQGASVNIK